MSLHRTPPVARQSSIVDVSPHSGKIEKRRFRSLKWIRKQLADTYDRCVEFLGTSRGQQLIAEDAVAPSDVFYTVMHLNCKQLKSMTDLHWYDLTSAVSKHWKKEFDVRMFTLFLTEGHYSTEEVYFFVHVRSLLASVFGYLSEKSQLNDSTSSAGTPEPRFKDRRQRSPRRASLGGGKSTASPGTYTPGKSGADAQQEFMRFVVPPYIVFSNGLEVLPTIFDGRFGPKISSSALKELASRMRDFSHVEMRDKPVKVINSHFFLYFCTEICRAERKHEQFHDIDPILVEIMQKELGERDTEFASADLRKSIQSRIQSGDMSSRGLPTDYFVSNEESAITNEYGLEKVRRSVLDAAEDDEVEKKDSGSAIVRMTSEPDDHDRILEKELVEKRLDPPLHDNIFHSSTMVDAVLRRQLSAQIEEHKERQRQSPLAMHSSDTGRYMKEQILALKLSRAKSEIDRTSSELSQSMLADSMRTRNVEDDKEFEEDWARVEAHAREQSFVEKPSLVEPQVRKAMHRFQELQSRFEDLWKNKHSPTITGKSVSPSAEVRPLRAPVTGVKAVGSESAVLSSQSPQKDDVETHETSREKTVGSPRAQSSTLRALEEYRKRLQTMRQQAASEISVLLGKDDNAESTSSQDHTTPADTSSRSNTESLNAEKLEQLGHLRQAVASTFANKMGPELQLKPTDEMAYQADDEVSVSTPTASNGGSAVEERAVRYPKQASGAEVVFTEDDREAALREKALHPTSLRRVAHANSTVSTGGMPESPVREGYFGDTERDPDGESRSKSSNEGAKGVPGNPGNSSAGGSAAVPPSPAERIDVTLESMVAEHAAWKAELIELVTESRAEFEWEANSAEFIRKTNEKREKHLL